jgi:hypothetical protein
MLRPSCFSDLNQASSGGCAPDDALLLFLAGKKEARKGTPSPGPLRGFPAPGERGKSVRLTGFVCDSPLHEGEGRVRGRVDPWKSATAAKGFCSVVLTLHAEAG